MKLSARSGSVALSVPTVVPPACSRPALRIRKGDVGGRMIGDDEPGLERRAVGRGARAAKQADDLERTRSQTSVLDGSVSSVRGGAHAAADVTLRAAKPPGRTQGRRIGPGANGHADLSARVAVVEVRDVRRRRPLLLSAQAKSRLATGCEPAERPSRSASRRTQPCTRWSERRRSRARVMNPSPPARTPSGYKPLTG